MRSRSRLTAGLMLGMLLAAAAGGCTRAKKLSSEDTSLFEDLRHGVLGIDRDADEYYQIVRQSRDSRGSGYRLTTDKFLIDKTVDAVQRLGKLSYERRESQAQVMDLLADVVASDPSALARTNAANSLTRLGARLPAVDVARQADGGQGMRGLVRTLDGLFQTGGLAARDPAAARTRAVQMVDQLGRMDLPTAALAREALRPLYTRGYLVNTNDAALRQATQRALDVRMRDVARLALREVVESDTAYLREEAVRGLKTLGDTGAQPVILRRLAREHETRVRAEIIEYLGTVPSSASVAALIPFLEDPDPTLKLKARQSMTRIAGRDLGFRRVTWTRWALARYPELAPSRTQNPPAGPLQGADEPSPSPPGMR